MTKRCLDVAGAAVVLVLATPILLLAMLAVRLTMGAPVLFRQARVGQGDRVFTLRKLRTMRDGTGDDAARLTTLGRVLRASSIDELPQLWNVLRGDMSLVGPRPLLPEYLGRYSAEQARRHAVRPGITGLAQVNGRNTLGWAERLALDVQYVDTRSIRLDLVILARTVGCLVGGRGVSAPGHATMPAFAGETLAEKGRERCVTS
ncbi:MAG TPA: sugar transferase [Candidatus Binatia bacterium]|nr:sugar transferase [Candidatus Binatia bacterium]